MFSYSHFLSVEINIHSHSFKKYIASINPENKEAISWQMPVIFNFSFPIWRFVSQETNLSKYFLHYGPILNWILPTMVANRIFDISCSVEWRVTWACYSSSRNKIGFTPQVTSAEIVEFECFHRKIVKKWPSDDKFQIRSLVFTHFH